MNISTDLYYGGASAMTCAAYNDTSVQPQLDSIIEKLENYTQKLRREQRYE